MSYLYTSPEAFGLRPVDEVEFSSGCYEFNLTVVWQDVETGALYYADDSGCSCPIPFEDMGRGDLERIARTQDLIDHLGARLNERHEYHYNDRGETCSDCEELRGQIGDLIQKVRAARQGRP